MNQKLSTWRHWKNFPKHIKKLFKTDDGILKRFNLKLKYWDEDNAIF